MFGNFDFKILENPEFKEDAVREELVLPLIKALGYQVSGDSRIIRSKSLTHPYVAIGSKQRKISIIPDYVFLSEGKPYWVLDAKSPVEDITKSKHVEQAYSYAIHPEVRAELFALCNGHDFALFSIKKFEPLLQFSLSDIEKNWDLLYRILNPKIKANPDVTEFHLDYGVHLRRLGAPAGFGFVGLAINSKFVCKVEDGLYTASTVIPAEADYLMSLDFNEEQLSQLIKILPSNLADKLTDSLSRQPYHVLLENEEFQFGVNSELTETIIHNAEESYLPFKVIEFMPYMNLEEK